MTGLAKLVCGLAVVSFILVGCGSKTEPEPPKGPEVAQVKIAPVTHPDPSKAREFAAFEQATVADPPNSTFPPVDKTLAGKVTGKMYEAIARKGGLWDEIKLTDAEGKYLRYSVKLQTDAGDLAIELWPEIAPNHVRNFLALVKVGYYQGLNFHRTVRQTFKDEDGKMQVFAFLEAGCPRGTGEPGHGHIGYWLKPELHDPTVNPKVRHEEGTVGAWRGEELDTAACKFYITLSKAQAWDGNYTVFGKVTHGLEVARKILEQPVLGPDEPDRPKTPIVIRSVTIHVMKAGIP